MTIRSVEILERRDLLTVDLLPPIGEVALSSNPTDFILAGDFVYFSARSTGISDDLWRTDGTPGGTIRVQADTGRLSSLAVGSELYFMNSRLHRTSGTPQSTVELTDGNIYLSPSHSLVEYNGQVYFVGRDFDRTRNPDRIGEDLMRSGGTVENTSYANLHDADRNTNGARILGVWDERLHYLVRQSRTDVYRSTDGTLDGTVQPEGYQGEFNGMTMQALFGNYLLGRNEDAGTSELLSIDLSSGNSREEIDLDPASPAFPSEFLPTDQGVFFSASDTAHGTELWVTDGTSAGTKLVADVVEGPNDSQPTWLTVFQNRLVFVADHAIWSYDVGTSSLKLVKRFRNVPTSLGPQYLVVAGDSLYFVADGGNGDELWKYDGVSANEIIDLNPGSDGSQPGNLTIRENQLLFSAYVPEVGNELWVLDTTDDSIQLLADLRLGTTTNPPILPRDLFVFQGIGYFRMNDRQAGTELWRTDGTPAGTYMLADVNPGSGSSGPRQFFEFQEQLYFVANDGTHGYELWRTDGTAANTQMLRDLWPGIDGLIDQIVVGDTKFFFAGHDGVHGTELWESDGTAAGTRMAADLTEGFAATPISLLQAVGDNAYFYVDVQGAANETTFDVMRWDGENLHVFQERADIAGRLPIQAMAIWNGELAVIGSRNNLYYPADVRSSILGRVISAPLTPLEAPLGGGALPVGTTRGMMLVKQDGEVMTIDSAEVFETWTLGTSVVYSSGQNKTRVGLSRIDAESTEPEVLLENVELLASYQHSNTLWLLVAGDEQSAEVWSIAESAGSQPVSWGTIPNQPTAFVVAGDRLLYSARVNGTSNEHLYRFDLIPTPRVSVDTVDALFAAVRTSSEDQQFDRNGDGNVDDQDIDHLFEVELKTHQEDLDLSGTVDFADFLTLSANFGRTDEVPWSAGDLDQDGEVGFADFLRLSAKFGS